MQQINDLVSPTEDVPSGAEILEQKNLLLSPEYLIEQNFECGEWGDCLPFYDFDYMSEDEISLKGEQRRICDNNEIEKIVRRRCKLRKDITIDKVELLPSPSPGIISPVSFLEVSDNEGKLVSRIEIFEEGYKKANFEFFI